MSKMNNLSGLMKNGKSRSVIFVTLTLVLLVGLIAFVILRKPAQTLPAEIRGVSQVKATVKDDRQLGEMDPKYQELFDRQNELNANKAEEMGKSQYLKIGDDPQPKEPEMPPQKEEEVEPPRPLDMPRVSSRQPSSARQAQKERPAPHPAVMDLISRKWAVGGHQTHLSHASVEYAPAGAAQAAASGQGAAENNADSSSAPEKVLYKSGTIIAATMVNTVNSDNPGSVIAKIHSGPLAGGTIIGQAESGAGGVGVRATFSRIVSPDGREFAMQGEALSEGDMSNLLATDIDRKLLNRFVFRPIGYFAKGMADAVLANANAENTTADERTGLTTIVNEKLDTREQVRVGLGMATSEMLKDLDDPMNIRPTTTVARNEVFGVVMLSPVVE